MSSASHPRALIALLLAAAAGAGCQPSAAPVELRIELAVLEDKSRGGWAGQMIGVTHGAPTELQCLERLVPEEAIPSWDPERHGSRELLRKAG